MSNLATIESYAELVEVDEVPVCAIVNKRWIRLQSAT
jgi:hypothetical protein